MINQCPICNQPIKAGEQLVLEFVPPRNWWVLKHYRDPKEHELTLPNGKVLHCGLAGIWEAAHVDLASALANLYEETADYIQINKLSPVHHKQSMQRARDAILAHGGKVI